MGPLAILISQTLGGADKGYAGLPFQTETNTGFGILFKTYLDVTLYSYESETPLSSPEAAESKEAKEAKTQALDFVEQSFESVKMPRLEVERGFRFWDAVSLVFFALIPSYTLSPLHATPPPACAGATLSLSHPLLSKCLPHALESAVARSLANQPDHDGRHHCRPPPGRQPRPPYTGHCARALCRV